MNTGKTTGIFSKPLFKQDIKSNWILILVILVIMIMMANVVNFAMSMMGKDEITEEMEDAQETLYSHLFIMAGANAMPGNDEFTLEDFMESDDKDDYKMIFDRATDNSDEEFSIEALEDATAVLKDSPVDMDTYVENFEYVYAMTRSEGVFSGDELELDEMMSNMLEMSGMSTNLIDSMAEMDTTSLLNEMYFHVMGLLPIFILIVVVGNALIVGQVDRGSLAYALSTPTKRSAVAITQAIFMIVVPLVMIFIVSLMGLFGSDNLVTMGIGVEQLGIFNKLTLVSLFDIDALQTVGTDNVDETFIWKLAILAAISIISYIAGAIKFCKKDLPL